MRLYTAALDGTVDWENGSFGVLLLKTTDTDPANEYQFDPDHATVDDVLSNGGSEVSVSGYSRQSLTTTAPSIDNTNNWAKFDATDLDFGTLGAGQNVYGILVYEEGASDSARRLIAFDNGYIPVTAAADASSTATTIWVDPLLDNLPSGAPVDFGGGATGTQGSAASKGARSITIAGAGIAAGVTAGDKDASVRTTRVSTQATPPALAYLNNGDFSTAWDANGVYVVQGKGNAV